MGADVIWLSDSDVSRLLDPARLIEAVERGLLDHAAGLVRDIDAVRMDGLGSGEAYLSVFPAHDATSQLASAKVLFGDPSQARQGRAEIDAVVVVADAMRGGLIAVIEARQMTALRTAAMSALAIRRFMQGASPRIVGVVGTGVQAIAHARLLGAAGLASRFVVASARGDISRAERAAAAMTVATGIAASAGPLAVLLDRADIIITASLSNEPLFDTVPDHCSVLAAVGPFLPHSHEIPPALLGTAGCIVSDHPERLSRQWSSLGERHFKHSRVVSLADLVAGSVALQPTGRRIYLSDGRGFADNVAAGLVLAAAAEQGIGQRLR